MRMGCRCVVALPSGAEVDDSEQPSGGAIGVCLIDHSSSFIA